MGAEVLGAGSWQIARQQVSQGAVTKGIQWMLANLVDPNRRS